MQRTLLFLWPLLIGAVGCTTDDNPLYSQGHKQGECFPNGTCNADLKCVQGICRELAQDKSHLRFDASLPDQGALDALDLALPDRGALTRRPIDMLFVIDNSSSMEKEQAKLSAEIDKLINGLRRYQFGPDGSSKPCLRSDESGCRIPDIRIGVISTNIGVEGQKIPMCEGEGDGGRLLHKARVAGCTPPENPWIAYDGHLSNVAKGSPDHIARVSEAFRCISKIGVEGCGFERPLEAARRALDPTLNVNPGFIRENASLAIIFVTDEDDCSAQNPLLYDPTPSIVGTLSSFRCFKYGVSCDQKGDGLGPRKSCEPAKNKYFEGLEGYVAFFRSLKPEGKLLMAALAGPTSPVEVGLIEGSSELQPSCRGAKGVEAVPAIRLKAVVDAFPSYFGSICSASYSAPLATIARLIN
jgi:hypothetical protein